MRNEFKLFETPADMIIKNNLKEMLIFVDISERCFTGNNVVAANFVVGNL